MRHIQSTAVNETPVKPDISKLKLTFQLINTHEHPPTAHTEPSLPATTQVYVGEKSSNQALINLGFTISLHDSNDNYWRYYGAAYKKSDGNTQVRNLSVQLISLNIRAALKEGSFKLVLSSASANKLLQTVKQLEAYRKYMFILVKESGGKFPDEDQVRDDIEMMHLLITKFSP